MEKTNEIVYESDFNNRQTLVIRLQAYAKIAEKLYEQRKAQVIAATVNSAKK